MIADSILINYYIIIMYISKHNAHFQLISAVARNRKKRAQLKQFLVEGVVPINNLVKGRFKIISFITDDSRKLSSWTQEIIATKTYEEHISLSTELFSELTHKDEAPEIIALVERKDFTISELIKNDLKKKIWVIMDRPISPGNLGTLMRSGNAFGISGLITYGHGADMYSHKAISASRGSLFHTPHMIGVGIPEINKFITTVIKEFGSVQILGTDEDAPRQLNEVDFDTPTIIMLGNETKGLSEKLTELCNDMIAIPMQGDVSSLNVACAGSIILHAAAN